MTAGRTPRRALITGGANGFGLATAAALLQRGDRVTIADIDRRQLDAARRTLPDAGLHAVELDVTRPASVRQAVQASAAAHGGLDCLVNCAGVIHLATLAEIGEEDWDRTIDVDLKGTFLCSQAAAPHLAESGRGRIVNIGSDASRVGFPMIPHYCAAKHGVIGLTRALAGELAPARVTVNCVCPVGRADHRHGASGGCAGRRRRPAPRRRRSAPPPRPPSRSAATPPRATWSPPSCSSSATRRRS